MAKTRLKRKAPKERALELASKYVLKYSPDGSSFQLYEKENEEAGPVNVDNLWEEGQHRLFRGKRYRTNKLLERYASSKSDNNTSNDVNNDANNTGTTKNIPSDKALDILKS